MEPFAQPFRVTAYLSAFDQPWFIAGGWAIDLFLGKLTRTHEDIEIAVLRKDQHRLQRYLTGWTFMKIVPQNGYTVETWPLDEWLDLPIHELHASRQGDCPFTLEILLNEADDDRWSLRRNLAVQCPLARMGLTTTEGIPILSPEIVLLYKAANPRDKDEVDFGNALSSLEPERRAWLTQALITCYPKGHPWIEKLK